MKKKLIVASLMVLVLQVLMAEEWYVCLGSFQVKENADICCESLEKNNLPSWIYLANTPKGDFYRVLYDVPKDNIEQARRLRDAVAVSKGAKAMNLDGLWVCTAKRADVIEPEIKPEIKPEPKKTETVKTETSKTDVEETTTTVSEEFSEEELPEAEELPVNTIINDDAK